MNRMTKIKMSTIPSNFKGVGNWNCPVLWVRVDIGKLFNHFC